MVAFRLRFCRPDIDLYRKKPLLKPASTRICASSCMEKRKSLVCTLYDPAAIATAFFFWIDNTFIL